MVIFQVKEKFIPPQPISQRENIRKKRLISLNNHFFLILVLLFLIRFSISIITPIFPLFVQEIAVSSSHLASTAGIILALSGLASAFSAIISGKLRDKTGAYKNILISSMLLTGIFCILQPFSKTTFQLLWVRLGYGLMAGGIITLTYTIIGSITSKEKIGKRFGIAGSISALGIAIGPLTGGTIASIFTVKIPFFIGGIGLLFTAIITFFILRHVEKN
ncbi:MFS transporter, partial [Candidatus Calescamantes bacterium]|nr:MFS transporter [Candidatus Calescamantes bacterium]